MLNDENILSMCGKLLEKSKANNVLWIETRKWRHGGGHIYSVKLQQSEICVGFNSPTSDPDFYMFSFYSLDNLITHKAVFDVGTDLWSVLCDLYQDADRCVRKWDIALNEVFDAIDQEGVIGTQEGLIGESDLPF